MERPNYPNVGGNERKPVGKALPGNQTQQSGGGGTALTLMRENHRRV